MNTSYNSRLQMKTDTEANWNKAVNFIPLKGEICIYSDLLMMKIGDGETLIADLPFATVSEVYVNSLFNEQINILENLIDESGVIGA